MSAWTSAQLADRRRDLVDRDVRAGTPIQRAATYLTVQQQTPALVRWWSWWRSCWEGVWPSRVREALAAALDLDEFDLHLLDANERMGEALVAIGMALGLPRPTAQHHWGAPEILAAIRTGTATVPAPSTTLVWTGGRHQVDALWDEDTGDIIERRCSCGERWRTDQDECPAAEYDACPDHGAETERITHGLSGDLAELRCSRCGGPVEQ